ncbi:hypothetical protein BLNAU_12378 [Blattamonas nauphoetae]|uniref:Uncharacterized protein n=1 Tax=Blattamonas nauphoetae TaxID=2049346 RepID=A0ABQ9XLV6_9EUKA|nr:hypothetical protein BLNAU_12378 [Blattamonas nauphoetae]
MFESDSTNAEGFIDSNPLIRVSVFEPAKQYVTFMFQNYDRLTLDHPIDREDHENAVCLIHCHLKIVELRSDEHEPAFVSVLVKWEVRTMVEMEYETYFAIVIESVGNRTHEWQECKQDRQKRRERLLREEGWDDALDLRVVGIHVDTPQKVLFCAKSPTECIKPLVHILTSEHVVVTSIALFSICHPKRRLYSLLHMTYCDTGDYAEDSPQ